MPSQPAPRGYALDVDTGHEPAPFTRPVVGIIAASTVSPRTVAARMRAGLDRHPDTVLVLRRGDKVAVQAADMARADYVIAGATKNHPREVRDAELLHGCSRLIVFHAPGSSVTDWFVRKARDWPYSRIWADKVSIVEGKRKPRRSGAVSTVAA